MTDDREKRGRERRKSVRFPTRIEVDYRSGENFLFSYIENISEMGIFIRSDEPLPLGTELELKFGRPSEEPFEMTGVVMWVNPVKGADNLNPGMGVQFTNLTPELRERIVDLIQTIAYLNSKDPKSMN